MDYRAEFDLIEFKEVAGAPAGTFTARVAAFNNVDRNGDRLLPGAFLESIKRWLAKGAPVPVVFSHNHNDPDSFIGSVNPADLVEDQGGLMVKGQMDLEDNPKARRIFGLLKAGRIKEWSFAYIVKKERVGKDGARELQEVDLLEVGPTLIGANPDTATIALKSYIEDGGDEPETDPETLPEPAIGAKISAGVAEAVAEFDTQLEAVLEEKIGRAISAKRESSIRAAIAELTSILDGLTADEEPEGKESHPEVMAVEDVPADPPGEAELLRKRVDKAGAFLARRTAS